MGEAAGLGWPGRHGFCCPWWVDPSDACAHAQLAAQLEPDHDHERVSRRWRDGHGRHHQDHDHHKGPSRDVVHGEQGLVLQGLR